MSAASALIAILSFVMLKLAKENIFTFIQRLPPGNVGVKSDLSGFFV
jgi:hypothetical protein